MQTLTMKITSCFVTLIIFFVACRFSYIVLANNDLAKTTQITSVNHKMHFVL